ncbi:alpha/beta hydrolase [Desulfurispirillum indicum]|uniref:AB hydrolase-1 domain-containing protein n=1 Tax=Desulfurispirillum indicum (strain ATCC BAA-1389 / DSM 22839 / S5) TaxID=653733 RepID=E6W601_DESIS|nr:alpha/beta hydrolase [Desulfurispirillum indicum]ADU64940.1 hypothetical protein Selin_0183 [Desulfurispirillum indicum S5]UCZ56876.1 alpha/beta hydrolase [Desulfurispirillum indicum]
MLRTLVMLMLLAGIFYGLLVLGMYLLQARLLFFPSSRLEATPGDIGLDYRDVRFQAADDTRLHGWFVPVPQARATVIFFHGNAGNISHRLQTIRVFHDLGLSVLIFDYRGYGLSEGTPDEKGLQLDAVAAWQAALAQPEVDAERIVFWGRSLGGSIAACGALQAQRQGGAPVAVVLESTFTSLPDLAAQLYPFLPARRLSRFHFDTRDAAAQLVSPLLVVHSRDDEVVPFSHGEELSAISGPEAFVVLRGGHNDGFLRDAQTYRQGVEAFLRRHLP